MKMNSNICFCFIYRFVLSLFVPLFLSFAEPAPELSSQESKLFLRMLQESQNFENTADMIRYS